MATFHTPLADTIIDKIKSFYIDYSLGSRWEGVAKGISLCFELRNTEGYFQIFSNVLLHRGSFYGWNSQIKCASLIETWIDLLKHFIGIFISHLRQDSKRDV